MISILRNIILTLLLLLISGCVATHPNKSIKKNRSFELTPDQINKELALNLPVEQKIDDNRSINIINADVDRDAKTKHGVEISSDFIYKNFAIPEGISGQIILHGRLIINEENNTLYLYGLRAKEYIFADKKLSEYITKDDKKLIEQIVSDKLSLIPLHYVSKKIKRVNISKDKISMTYNNGI